jgi:hypothetical protein
MGTERRYDSIVRTNGGLAVLNGPCEVKERDHPFETSTRRFDVHCTGPGTIALPISYNSVSDARLSGKLIRYHRIDDDPRMVVEIPSASSGTLTVGLPTLRRILMKLMP